MNAARTSAAPPFAIAARVAAAAWRLAGASAVAVADDAPAEDLVAAFDAGCAAAASVLVDVECAARLPGAALAPRRRSHEPLVALVDSVAVTADHAATAEAAVPDAVRHARRVLGVSP